MLLNLSKCLKKIHLQTQVKRKWTAGSILALTFAVVLNNKLKKSFILPKMLDKLVACRDASCSFFLSFSVSPQNINFLYYECLEKIPNFPFFPPVLSTS